MISNSHFTSLDNLKGKILVASPQLNGSCFEKAVIYICEHSAEGAMGLVLNHALPSSRKSIVFEQFDLGDVKNHTLPNIHVGGPVEITRGFIFHTDEYSGKSTQLLEGGFSLSSSVDVLKDIANGKGPQNVIITLGYAGWDGGQMEEEIEQDSWLIAQADKELIFSTNKNEQWQHAAKNAGIANMLQYSPIIGHA